MTNTREDMQIVIVGHVDHGKSTIVGRLMADTDSLPLGKLEAVKERCRRNARPFEYAFLLDALKDEQAQGITIDSARCFFKTQKRDYILIDAPGHVEFLKNMVTGAARADAALLVIDAHEGVKENSRRHGYLLSMLGIKQVAVLVNKMDLVDYDQGVYNAIVDEYEKYLASIGVSAAYWLPVSGMKGDNIAAASENMPWFENSGQTVLSILDSFVASKVSGEADFRMPVQDVYKFTNDNDERRILAGTIESGTISVGDEIIFNPSGKRSRVKTIEKFNEDVTVASAGEAIGLTLHDQLYVRRGDLVSKAGEGQPSSATRIKANVFWLGRNPLKEGNRYAIKLGSARFMGRIEKILRVMNASSLEKLEDSVINRHDVGEVIIRAEKSFSCDLPETSPTLCRFVMVDGYEIAGGGLIQETLTDESSWVRSQINLREEKWSHSYINISKRMERYSQRPTLIFVTGLAETDRKSVARELERRLFKDGRLVYCMSMGNLMYGIDSDLHADNIQERTEEHFRRLSELANLMMDAGLLFIVSIRSLKPAELQLIKTLVNDWVSVVWVGPGDDDGVADFVVGDQGEQTIYEIKEFLARQALWFNWE